MTPCSGDGVPNHEALVETGCSLIEAGMRAVVYCGSMGDWPLLTDEQRQAVLDRDYIRLLQLGANVYYTFKIVSHDRQPPQVMYGKMSSPPMSFDEFQEMMINGGRPIDGNRSKKEIDNG